MDVRVVAAVLLGTWCGLVSGSAHSGDVQVLVINPDPACRTNKLTSPIEQALTSALRVAGVEIRRGEARPALTLQYVIVVHPEGSQVTVQLDAQVVGNRSGRLLAEASVHSDPFAADVAGQQQAARQAAERLAERLAPALGEALAGSAKRRRVMLQVEFDEALVPERAGVLERLQQALKSCCRPRVRGMTERTLVLTLFAEQTPAELAGIVNRVLDRPRTRVDWVMKSDSTLMLRLAPKSSQ